MIKKILNTFRLTSLEKTSKHQKIQTFTYFIPAPPKRETGYREKQFDKLFYEFINKGYEILSINTQECTSSQQSGMWFICTVRSLNEKSSELELGDLVTQDKIQTEIIDNTVYFDADKENSVDLKLHK